MTDAAVPAATSLPDVVGSVPSVVGSVPSIAGSVPLVADALSGGPLLGLPLTQLWFAVLFFILGMFLFLDGFDFGTGVLFALRDDEHEREQLLAAIGPFWDGNEVWLVVFGGAMFAAFPPVYANLFSRHYLLMFAILAGLFLRGLAPEMFEQREDEAWRTWWGRSFAVGSAVTPFLVGLFAGNWVVGATSLVSLPGVVVGLALVALCVVTGVAFVRLKSRGPLRAEVAPFGLQALVAYLVLVVAALGSIYVTTPALQSELLSPAVIGLVVLTVVLAVGYALATRQDRYHVAFTAGAGLVFTFVVVVASLLYPYVDPATDLTASEAIVSTLPLNLMTIMGAILIPIVLGYFGILYSTFAGPIEPEETY